MDLIELGKIVRPHGIRGRLILRLDESMLDAVKDGTRLELRTEGRNVGDSYEVRRADRHGGGLLLALDGIEDRSTAEPLVGRTAWIDQGALPASEPGEYYDFEVQGARVVTPEGVELGRIVEIMITGANDVYVAQGERGEILIPAVEGAVLEIDPAEARIVVDPNALEYQDEKPST